MRSRADRPVGGGVRRAVDEHRAARRATPPTIRPRRRGTSSARLGIAGGIVTRRRRAGQRHRDLVRRRASDLPAYLDAVERLVAYVDGWSATWIGRGVGQGRWIGVAAWLVVVVCVALRRGARAAGGALEPRRRRRRRPSRADRSRSTTSPHVIDAANAAAIDRMIRALKAATGDVVVVATVPTIEPLRRHPRVRDQAVREPRHGHRREGQKQRPADPARAQGAPRLGRGRLRRSSSGSPTASPARRAASTWRRSSATGSYGAGLRAGTERIIGRIAQGRGVTLEGVRVPRERPRPPAAADPGLAHRRHLHRHPDHQPHRRRPGRRAAALGRRVERLVERRRTVRRRLGRRRMRRRFGGGGGGFGGGFGGGGGGGGGWWRLKLVECLNVMTDDTQNR